MAFPRKQDLVLLDLREQLSRTSTKLRRPPLQILRAPHAPQLAHARLLRVLEVPLARPL
jgi:hypothetical protein